jgi:hypothetical protein
LIGGDGAGGSLPEKRARRKKEREQREREQGGGRRWQTIFEGFFPALSVFFTNL